MSDNVPESERVYDPTKPPATPIPVYPHRHEPDEGPDHTPPAQELP